MVIIKSDRLEQLKNALYYIYKWGGGEIHLSGVKNLF